MFHPDYLRDRLAAVTSVGRCGFAAACATRALGGFRFFVRETKASGLETLEAATDFVWRNLRSPSNPMERIASCEVLLENTSEAWEMHRPWAQGAVLATIAALRALSDPEPDIVVEPAVYALDAIDLKIIYDAGLDMNVAANERIVQEHPAMIRELDRQRRDLEELAARDVQALEEAWWIDFRDRAELESRDFLPDGWS